jgi:hypothetical protein
MKNDKLLNFYLPESVADQFAAVSHKQGLNMSVLLRILVLKELRRAEKQAAK